MTEGESKPKKETKKVIPINKYSIFELKSGVDQNILSVKLYLIITIYIH